MIHMNRRDLLAGLFWLAVAVFVAIQSFKSDLGSLHSPGPGFLPFWSSVVLGVLSITLTIGAGLKKTRKDKLLDLWRGLDWGKVFLILFALFLYPLLLPLVGYLIMTFVLIAYLLFVGIRSKLWIDIATAVAITLVSYLIFYTLLDVKLPKGMLGL